MWWTISGWMGAQKNNFFEYVMMPFHMRSNSVRFFQKKLLFGMDFILMLSSVHLMANTMGQWLSISFVLQLQLHLKKTSVMCLSAYITYRMSCPLTRKSCEVAAEIMWFNTVRSGCAARVFFIYQHKQVNFDALNFWEMWEKLEYAICQSRGKQVVQNSSCKYLK